MVNYTKVNNFLNGVFFDESHASMHVYLSLEDDHKEELSAILGVDAKDVDFALGQVASDSLLYKKRNIYQGHVARSESWKKGDYDSPPPFTALLVTLALAAERMRRGENYSANNYYRRLFEVLGVSGDEYKETKIKHAARFTVQFWTELNEWLASQDYIRGRPTAKRINNWKYVSYALSQALVRQADRVRFHRMFAAFGLSPHDQLGDKQVELYLDQWMQTATGPSPWLKRMWDSPELRERVVSSATNELESWDGVIEGPGGRQTLSSSRRMSWIVSIKRFPRTRAQFYLVTGSPPEQQEGELQLASNSSETARMATSDASKLWFADLPGSGLKYLAPVENIRLSALFHTHFRLENREDGTSYSHSPRLVIPLVKDDSGLFYREVSRASVHTPHIVVCHASWRSRVRGFLEQFAAPGITEVAGDGPNGIPEGWTLFLGVEIAGYDFGELSEDLECLAPIVSGATIDFSGGLKIVQNIWHSVSPPAVLGMDVDGTLKVKLESNDPNRDDAVLCATGPEKFDESFIEKYEGKLDTLNLRITGWKGKKLVGERDISFRSAETPRRRQASKEEVYCYSLARNQDRAWGMSAVPEEKIEPGLTKLLGMSAVGKCHEIKLERLLKRSRGINVEHQGVDLDAEYDMTLVSGEDSSCFVRGYHVWQLPYFGREKPPASFMGTCSDCGAEQVFVRRKKTRKKKRTAMRRPRGGVQKIDVRRKEEKLVSLDVAQDAICYLGSGTGASLDRVLAPTVSSPWEMSTIRPNLVDLGLIDAELGDGMKGLTHWSCAPACLVVGNERTVFLSGFRNPSLVEQARKALKPVTRSYNAIQQEHAPVAHIWRLKRGAEDKLEEALSGLEDSAGRALRVVEAPGLFIAKQMPPLSEITGKLHVAHLEDRGDIEKFDPATGRWSRARLAGAGCYRASFAGRRYFFRDKRGKVVETTYPLVKLMAARSQGLRLHAYYPKKRTFECVLGCQPPGLLRRALVSCSGELPTRQDNRLVYAKVPKELGYLVLQKLYW